MSDLYKSLKKFLTRVRTTAFHPQWFVYRHQHQQQLAIAKILRGKILDIGCADQPLRPYLPQDADYIGLDYYSTAVNWYETRPMLYGDAQALPLATESIDCVLLLDVLEHLPRPDDCLQEIKRVLKPQGILILQVPFLYPIHDAPLDFQRWTTHGLRQQIAQQDFVLKEEIQTGKPLETAALLMNIALSKTLLNWIKAKHPALILGLFVPPLVLGINLLCWLVSYFSPEDGLMPHSYRWVLEKQA